MISRDVTSSPVTIPPQADGAGKIVPDVKHDHYQLAGKPTNDRLQEALMSDVAPGRDDDKDPVDGVEQGESVSKGDVAEEIAGDAGQGGIQDDGDKDAGDLGDITSAGNSTKDVLQDAVDTITTDDHAGNHDISTKSATEFVDDATPCRPVIGNIACDIGNEPKSPDSKYCLNSNANEGASDVDNDKDNYFAKSTKDCVQDIFQETKCDSVDDANVNMTSTEDCLPGIIQDQNINVKDDTSVAMATENGVQDIFPVSTNIESDSEDGCHDNVFPNVGDNLLCNMFDAVSPSPTRVSHLPTPRTSGRR